jgi:Rnl2 family RNA ligase
MKFKRYSSIEQVYREVFIDKITLKGPGLTAEEWCVTEKAHGANFSFLIGKEGKLTVAKRSGLVKPDEKFYNYKRVVDKYGKVMQKIADLVISKSDDLVQIYGELIGGNYPHPNVDKIKGVGIVQKGIYYTPDQDFYLFDIAVNDKFVDYLLVDKIASDFNIPHAIIAFNGTFSECTKWSAEHNADQSRIHEQFGLPTIEDNIREGNVLKPFVSKYIGESRVILKDKNEKWKEKEQRSKREKKPPEPLSEGATAYYQEALTYITQNRLENVISKIGSITQKDFGKLLGLFVKDALEDFNKDNQNNLDKTETNRVNKLVNAAAATLIREDFINIIDRTNT